MTLDEIKDVLERANDDVDLAVGYLKGIAEATLKGEWIWWITTKHITYQIVKAAHFIMMNILYAFIQIEPNGSFQS